MTMYCVSKQEQKATLWSGTRTEGRHTKRWEAPTAMVAPCEWSRNSLDCRNHKTGCVSDEEGSSSKIYGGCVATAVQTIAYRSRMTQSIRHAASQSKSTLLSTRIIWMEESSGQTDLSDSTEGIRFSSCTSVHIDHTKGPIAWIK